MKLNEGSSAVVVVEMQLGTINDEGNSKWKENGTTEDTCLTKALSSWRPGIYIVRVTWVEKKTIKPKMTKLLLLRDITTLEMIRQHPVRRCYER